MERYRMNRGLALLSMMGLSALTVAASGIAAGPEAWHWPQGIRRVLVRVSCSGKRTMPARAPVVVPSGARRLMDKDGASIGVRAWEVGEGGRETPVQCLGDDLLLAPDPPPKPGTQRFFYVYAGPADAMSVAAPARVQVSADGRVTGRTYAATIDLEHGGVLRSLVFTGGARPVETLGHGIHWWVGRKPQITQESFGKVQLIRGVVGSLFCEVRTAGPDLLAPGNALTMTYRFFPDFIDLDYHYHTATPVSLLWFKLPVSLAATGPTPGLHSTRLLQDQPLRVDGEKNTWISDADWQDVSYSGAQPFGLGVIARDRIDGSGLWFMDSVRPDEQEWIYAEPFGWRKPVKIASDFRIRLRVVPHASGKGQWRETAARVDTVISVRVSAVHEKGGAPIDTDGDGLSDLAEYRAGTNPLCSDTDADGTPDGRDRHPLQGRPPAGGLDLPRFKAVSTRQPQTRARIESVGGVPTLTLDGKPYGPMFLTRGSATYPQLRELADCGIRVFFEMVGSIGWPDEQTMFFRRLDSRLNRFLDEVPNARIVLRLYVCNPPHFARDYPHEVLRFNDGSVSHFTKWYAMRDRPPEERGYPSFASEVWRHGTSQALYNLVAHVRRAEYAKNVIGYFICGGGTEEWYYWGDYDHHRYCVDFSKPMLRAFLNYLRRKYGGDVRRLRTAWNDPEADFATALPPGPERFDPPASGVFWDPGRDQRIRDYYYVHNKVMEDSLLIFSHTVKQACRGEQLVGMFHGYLQNHWLVEGGQATLKDLLNSPDVDFWSGPPQYNRRGPGEHACIRFLPATFKRHRKLWINESDIRTNFVPPDPKVPAIYGRPQTLDQSLGCLEREFAHLLCEGVSGWWFPMGRQWYNHSPILELFRKQQHVSDAALGVDRRSVAEIAVVVDLESLLTGPSFPISSAVLDAFKVQELCRIGAPVDFLELDDVLARRAPHYRMLIFLNCFSLTDAERKLVDRRLRRKGAVLVWMFAPGLFNPDGAPEKSFANIRSLLGFGVTSERGDALALDMRLTPVGAGVLKGFDPKHTFGSFERAEWGPGSKPGEVRRVPARPFRVRERFIGLEGETLPATVQVLARFTDNGKPAMTMRTGRDATDVWIGSVMAPAALLRAMAKRAGCHVYCDADEIMYASRSFLAIHTAVPGKRLFRLRGPSDVTEVLSGHVLGRHVTEFTDDIPAFETRIYTLAPEREWRTQTGRADRDFAELTKELAAGREVRAARPKTPAAVSPARILHISGPFPLAADGMVRTFLVCGPFPSPGSGESAKGFDTAFIDEAAATPAPSAGVMAEFRAMPGSPEAVVWFGEEAGGVKRLRNVWTACQTSSELPYLAEQLPALTPTENIAYYTAVYVEPERAGPVRLGIGSDDGFKLWVNGAFVGGRNTARSLGIDSDRFTVHLKTGRNLILLKIVQGGGPTGWSLRLRDAAGAPLRNCRLWLRNGP